MLIVEKKHFLSPGKQKSDRKETVFVVNRKMVDKRKSTKRIANRTPVMPSTLTLEAPFRPDLTDAEIQKKKFQEKKDTVLKNMGIIALARGIKNTF